jgi:hypothetical protein
VAIEITKRSRPGSFASCLNSTIGDESALVDFLYAKIVQPKDSSRPKSYAYSHCGYLFLDPVFDDTAIASKLLITEIRVGYWCWLDIT